MKPLSCSVAFAVVIARALADAPADAKTAAQSLYDDYMVVLKGGKDPQKWIGSSDRVTPAFKQAYRAYMKRPESDPLLSAQDYPDAGFKVSLVNVKGDTALVTFTSRDPSFSHTFRATFTFVKGKWLLSRTQDIRP
jgi:hypothetical protein